MVIALAAVLMLSGCGDGRRTALVQVADRSAPSAERESGTTDALASPTPAEATTAEPAPAPVPNPAPTQAPQVTSAPPALPAYAFAIEAVSVERLGASYRAGCPVAPEQLRLVRLTHLSSRARPRPANWSSPPTSPRTSRRSSASSTPSDSRSPGW